MQSIVGFVVKSDCRLIHALSFSQWKKLLFYFLILGKKSIKILYNINEIKFNSTRMMKLGFRYNSTVTEENTIRSTFSVQKQPERVGSRY